MVYFKQDGVMMRVKITLTAMVLCSIAVVVIFLASYVFTESQKNAPTDMNIPKSESPLNYQLINIPGSDSCDHCHMEAQSPSTADHASAASDGY